MSVAPTSHDGQCAPHLAVKDTSKIAGTKVEVAAREINVSCRARNELWRHILIHIDASTPHLNG
jgi:hypothetical protein